MATPSSGPVRGPLGLLFPQPRSPSAKAIGFLSALVSIAFVGAIILKIHPGIDPSRVQQAIRGLIYSGMVIGAVVVFIILGYNVYYFRKKKEKERQEQAEFGCEMEEFVKKEAPILTNSEINSKIFI